jgi:DNA-binding phage protein
MVEFNIPLLYYKMAQYIEQLRYILRKRKISERALAQKSGVSRGTLRSILHGGANFRLNSLSRLLDVLGGQATVIAHVEEGLADCSSIATSINIRQDGFKSWKLHLMNMVDEFRRTRDVRLILLPPTHSLDNRIKALMASTVVELCSEVELRAPEWASRSYFLTRPWFVSGSESLKASAIVESPLAFRRNNIFVHSNFLSRK